jgi:hypothetical protein
MPTLSVVPPPRPGTRALRGLGYAAALVLVGAGGWLVNRMTAAPAEGPVARADTIAPPQPAPPVPAVVKPAATPTGKLRILTTPPSAEILVDGRRVGIGSVIDLSVLTGARRLRVQAAGYASWDSTIVVQAGVTHTLGRVTLRAPTE